MTYEEIRAKYDPLLAPYRAEMKRRGAEMNKLDELVEAAEDRHEAIIKPLRGAFNDAWYKMQNEYAKLPNDDEC